MESLETKLEQTQENKSGLEKVKDYVKGCFDPSKARLYGNFQERAALNITQFHKIQGSLLIRMGVVYPILSNLVDQMGIPDDRYLGIKMHTYVAGFLAYLVEIQAGLSKYPMEFITSSVVKAKNYFTKK